MKCANEGCKKPANPVDPYCSRACACAAHGVVYQPGSSGSTVGNIVRMAAGPPVAVLPLQLEAAERDRNARLRVSVQNKRAQEARARSARLELARKREIAAAPVERAPLWRDYLDDDGAA